MKNNNKKIIINLMIVILILISLITSGIVLVLYANKEIKEKVIIKEKKSYIQRSKKDLIQKENVVILGDSITELYPVKEIYDELPVLNSGVSGFKTQDILDRMDSMVYQYNPTKVILLIGINDLMPDKSKENQKYVVTNIEKIIALIKEKRSSAKIYLESIYPVNTKTRDGSEADDNEAIAEVNAELEKYAKDNKVIYIDMYHELLDKDGDFAKVYTNDGLHPNTMGYAKITSVLLPYIYE